jgi:glycosyltransferase involved in cell wall biosynthesis
MSALRQSELTSAVDVPVSAPLNVAIVTETYTPEVNGVAMTTARVVDGLLRRGHAITLIRPRQNVLDRAQHRPTYREVLVDGYAVPGYPLLRFGLPAIGELRRLWANARPDVVQVVTEGPLGWSAIGAARQLCIPVVSEFHTDFRAYSKHYRVGWIRAMISRYLRAIHNRAQLTLVPTIALARELAADGYANLRVVARGVDTRRFNPRRRAPWLRQSWQVTPDAPVVAYVGRLAPEKNLPLVFKAFDAIKSRVPKARLLLVGDGPQREAMQRHFPQHIFAGMRHAEDLADHYASADLFLFPSLSDTYGCVTLEALASGLPVVAYRTAAAAELVVVGEGGYLAPVGNEADFIRAAVALAAAPVSSADWRARIARSVSGMGWDPVSARIEQLLNEAVASHAPRALPTRAVHLDRGLSSEGI